MLGMLTVYHAEGVWYGFQDPGESRLKDARRAVELAAWQEVMPELYPEIASERVLDVVTVRSGRLLVLTDAHVAMLKVRKLLTAIVFH